MALKLNLGCGENHVNGYVNVDQHGAPDVRFNLEEFPWPWDDNSAEEVLMVHVLEHLGQTAESYLKIIQEIYRICAPMAQIRIIVPHHRHEYFYSDPTHVRPITTQGMMLFCQRINRKWIDEGSSNSPLGIYYNVDFEIVGAKLTPSEHFRRLHPNESGNVKLLMQENMLYNNMVEQVDMTMLAIKPAGSCESPPTPQRTA